MYNIKSIELRIRCGRLKGRKSIIIIIIAHVFQFYIFSTRDRWNYAHPQVVLIVKQKE